jgi:hypothetical protein
MVVSTFLKNARAAVQERLAQQSAPAETESADDLVADTMDREFKIMPFKFSGAKIASGEKTITVRPGVYPAGTYRDTVTDNLFNLIPEGHMTLNEFLDTRGMTKDEFAKRFLGREEAKLPHMKAFMEGETAMNIYSIRKSTGADDIIADSSDARYTSFYESKKLLLGSLKKDLKRTKGPAKDALRGRIEALEEQLKKLSNEDNHNLNVLHDMMSSDVDAVENILNSGADHAALNYAMKLIGNYAQMMDVQFRESIDMLDEETRNKLYAFQTRNFRVAKRIQEQMLAATTADIKAQTGRDTTVINGVSIYNKDISWKKRQVLDTSSTSHPAVQLLTRYISDALTKIRNRFEGFKSKNTKLVKALIAFQKSAGIKAKDAYNFMIQTDADGKRTGYIVSKLSHAYKSIKDSLPKGSLKRMVWYANNHKITVNAAANKERKERLKTFFKNTYAHQVELNEFDVARGTTYDQKLEEQARRYAFYQDASRMALIMEKARTTPAAIQPEEVEYFKRFEKNGGFHSELINGVHVYPMQMDAHAKWEDSRYKEIQNMSTDDPRRQFYDHWVESYLQGRRMISDQDNYMEWDYIPEKTAELDIMGSMREGLVNNLTQNISENIHGIDPITGEIEKRIPLYMNDHRLAPDEKSYDLGQVLEAFMHETINYDEKQKVEGPSLALLNMLKQEQIVDTNPDGSVKIINGQTQYKKGLSNTYMQAKYRVDANIYDERQDKEGVTNVKIMHTQTKRKLKAMRAEMEAMGLTEDEKIEAWDLIQDWATLPG